MVLNQTIITASEVIYPITARFLDLIKAPINNKEMLWIVTPLIVGLIIMKLYFARYKKEKLGWNTAIGNSLALIFVAADLLRHLYLAIPSLTLYTLMADNFSKLLVILVVALGSLWLLLAEFFHFIPEKFAFLISSSCFS